MLAVQADCGRLSRDAGRTDVLAAEVDSARLAYDARRAARTPPPVAAIPYTAAMRAYRRAGQLGAAGDWADAISNLDAGNALMGAATSEVTAATGS
jgi:hypothetical protein